MVVNEREPRDAEQRDPASGYEGVLRPAVRVSAGTSFAITGEGGGQGARSARSFEFTLAAPAKVKLAFSRPVEAHP